VAVVENRAPILAGEGKSIGEASEAYKLVHRVVQKLQVREQGKDRIEAPEAQFHHPEHEGADRHPREKMSRGRR
jgi:hypothetical protein